MSTVPKAVQAAANKQRQTSSGKQATVEACIVTHQLIDSNRAGPLKRNVVGNVHYVGTVEFAIIVSFASHGFEIHVFTFSHFVVIGVHATIQNCAPC